MPTGYPNSLDRVQERIRELQELEKSLLAKNDKRANLLQYCKENNFGRDDLRAVINDLPMERISRKQREQLYVERQRTKSGARKPHTSQSSLRCQRRPSLRAEVSCCRWM